MASSTFKAGSRRNKVVNYILLLADDKLKSSTGTDTYPSNKKDDLTTTYTKILPNSEPYTHLHSKLAICQSN